MISLLKLCSGSDQEIFFMETTYRLQTVRPVWRFANMGAEGFSTFVWDGWIFGTIFLQKPWGQPQFKSYIAIQPIWALAFLLVQIYFTLDAGINISTFNVHLVNDKLIEYINAALFILTGTTHLLTLLVFAVNAKLIATLLNKFYYYKKSENGHLGYNSRITWGCIYSVKLFSILLLVGHGAISTFLITEKLADASVLIKFLGPVLYFIVEFVGYVAIDSSTMIGLFLVTTTVFHLMEEHSDFCTSLGEEIALLRMGDGESKKRNRIDETFMKEYYLKKLDDLEQLFASADCFLGPLCLITISGSVLFLIPCAYGLATIEGLNYKDTVLIKASLGLQMGLNICKLTVLSLGQVVKNQVNI